MARAISYRELDDLDRLSRGEVISNASSEKDNEIQKQDQINIRPELIKSHLEDEAPGAYNIRQQYNDLDLDSTFDNLKNQYDRRAAADEQKQQSYDTADKMLSMLARKAGRGEFTPKQEASLFDSQAYQKSLKQQLDDLQKQPQDVTESQKILNAALPVLLSAGFGPSGAEAGVESFKVGQADLSDTRRRMENERLAKIQGIGKQIEGAGNLLRAENEKRRADLEERRYSDQSQDKNIEMLTNYSKWLTDNKIKDSSEAQKQFLDIQKYRDDLAEKGIIGTAKSQEMENERYFKAQENEKNRLSEEKRARINAQSPSKGADARKDRLIKDFRDDLDPDKPRSGNFGKAQASVLASKRIDALLQQFPDGNIPKAQTNELAAAMAALVSNGTPQSQHQIDSVTPSSLKGDVNGIIGWVTNKPKGLGQQRFMNALKESAAREKTVGEQYVKEAQLRRLPFHKALKEMDPQTYNEVLKSYNVVEGGNQGASSHPQDSEAVSWAKKNPKDPRAIKILKANGL